MGLRNGRFFALFMDIVGIYVIILGTVYCYTFYEGLDHSELMGDGVTAEQISFRPLSLKMSSFYNKSRNQAASRTDDQSVLTLSRPSFSCYYRPSFKAKKKRSPHNRFFNMTENKSERRRLTKGNGGF